MARIPYGNRVLATLLFALAGCAAERSVLTTNPDFTADALRQGGIAVVGVTVVNEVEQVRPPLVAALEAALRRYRNDVALRTVDATRDAVGLAAHRRILTGYQSSGALSEADRRELAAVLGPGVRFALLARIEKDAVHYSTPRRPGASVSGAPSAGNLVSAKVWRNAMVRVSLYDLAGGRPAWDAVYASSSENARPDTMAAFVKGGGSIVDAHGGPRDEPLPEPPPPPTLVEAAAEGFRAFIADLPGSVAAPTAPAPARP
jgi:hypothetical protein